MVSLISVNLSPCRRLEAHHLLLVLPVMEQEELHRPSHTQRWCVDHGRSGTEVRGGDRQEVRQVQHLWSMNGLISLKSSNLSRTEDSWNNTAKRRASNELLADNDLLTKAVRSTCVCDG